MQGFTTSNIPLGGYYPIMEGPSVLSRNGLTATLKVYENFIGSQLLFETTLVVTGVNFTGAATRLAGPAFVY